MHNVICLQNLQKLSKNLHPVQRYSPSKWVHFSCQNQFFRYNSGYGSRALLSIIGLNLGRPWAHFIQKIELHCPGFFAFRPQRDP